LLAIGFFGPRPIASRSLFAIPPCFTNQLFTVKARRFEKLEFIVHAPLGVRVTDDAHMLSVLALDQLGSLREYI
jgi:hypothetical protein